ncbi:bifunctional riboflavin kinase/FAD synthetase [Aeromicrobium duanguangcaii]|uniref:bifunctional riboflavin kinase/FAD synthetase n=1 Tax=Aeromicrobium duanguangcaii TaxID=2968086 RepID=UPI0020182F2B|nr:bifunctional riboflavin kinase/FAD synthetase [Aeromicrobium duanguangcaii]
MVIWKAVDGAPATTVPGPSAVTIGNFDGVHLGHQSLLAATRAAAGDATTVAITFDPHPVAIFAPERAPKRLTTVERRIELLHQHGADHVRVLNFTPEMASWSPDEFVRAVILDQCHAKAVVVGEGFRYGSRASGSIETLQESGRQNGFTAAESALAGDGVAFSSTRAREAVAAGEMERAAEILGRPHEVEGIVVEGDRRGRELGFPTANVPVDDSYAVPPDGVYAAWLVLADGTRLPAATSIGTNPTFEGVIGRRVESYVLDREDLDLYGRSVRVEFVARLREMVAYESLEALVEQMHRDVTAARAALRL